MRKSVRVCKNVPVAKVCAQEREEREERERGERERERERDERERGERGERERRREVRGESIHVQSQGIHLRQFFA